MEKLIGERSGSFLHAQAG